MTIVNEPAQQALPRLLDRHHLTLLITDQQYDSDKTNWLTQLPVAVRQLGDNDLLSREQAQGNRSLIGRFTAFYHRQQAQPLAPRAAIGAQDIQAHCLALEPPSLMAPQPSLALPASSQDYHDWLQSYCWQEQQLRHYQQRRNALTGLGNYSGMSVGLSLGSLSVRRLYQQITAHEQQLGSNDSTQAFVYELYCRQYFHWLAEQLGAELYGQTVELTKPQHQALWRWCQGETDNDWINAVSRRPHEFDWQRQQQRYDPDGEYLRLWQG